MEHRIQLMIGGAAKAGTTSLARYVGQHPRILMHSLREFSYFVVDQIYLRDFKDVLREYYPDGVQTGQILGAKSVQLMYSTTAMDRLKQHNPGVKIVLCLRNPIERAYSHFLHARRRGSEPLGDFGEAIWADRTRFGDDWERRQDTNYLGCGLYFQYIQELLKRFARDQLHFIRFDEFIKDPQSTCQRVFRIFPEIDPGFISNIGIEHNKSAVARSKFLARLTNSRSSGTAMKGVFRAILGRRRASEIAEYLRTKNEKVIKPGPIHPEVRQALREFYRQPNDELQAYLGWDLSLWE